MVFFLHPHNCVNRAITAEAVAKRKFTDGERLRRAADVCRIRPFFFQPLFSPGDETFALRVTITFELSFPRRDRCILRYNTVASPGIQLPIISITIVIRSSPRRAKYEFNSLLNNSADTRGSKNTFYIFAKYKDSILRFPLGDTETIIMYIKWIILLSASPLDKRYTQPHYLSLYYISFRFIIINP